MSDLTDYAEQAIRDWFSQGTAMPSAPGTLYVGLHTADPGESPDGSTEVSASDYDRVGETTGSGWNGITDGDATGFENANQVDYGNIDNNWGTITHVTLWDSQTDGNCLAAYALDSGDEGEATAGTDVYYPAGDLTFSLD